MVREGAAGDTLGGMTRLTIIGGVCFAGAKCTFFNAIAERANVTIFLAFITSYGFMEVFMNGDGLACNEYPFLY